MIDTSFSIVTLSTFRVTRGMFFSFPDNVFRILIFMFLSEYVSFRYSLKRFVTVHGYQI